MLLAIFSFIFVALFMFRMPVHPSTAPGFINTATDTGQSIGYRIPRLLRDVYSNEIIYQAMPQLRFRQFAKVKSNTFGEVHPGKTISFTKIPNIRAGKQLTELEPITAVQMEASSIQVTCNEFGVSMGFTEFAVRAALYDTIREASVLLAKDYAMTLDSHLRDTCLDGSVNIVYGKGKASPSQMTLDDGFSVQAIKDAVEILTYNNTPRIGGQFYIGICTPHQLRQLRDNPEWIDAQRYAGSRQLFIGEAGMYEGVVFISTSMMPDLTPGLAAAKYGSTAPQGFSEGLIFGDNMLGFAELLPVELRESPPVDFGRQIALAWYSIFGSGIIENKNLVRVVTSIKRN